MSPCDIPGISTVCDFDNFATDPGGAISDAAASGFRAIVESMCGAFGRMLDWCLSWWVHLPSPDLTQMSALSTIREYTTGLQVLLMTGAVMITGARLALARRGSLAGEVQESFMTFARAVFASWMFAAVITVATRSGDGFSDWVIGSAIRDPSTATAHLTNFSALLGQPGLGLAGMFVLSLLGFVGALLQLALLVIRQALLIVVVAVIPIAASAAGTGPGSQAYKKLISWSIAFALFKPVGALVYVVAFEAAGSTSGDAQQQLLGLILLALVALVLPALMRMVAPAISSMGAGGGGVAAAAMVGGVGMAAAAGAKAGAGGTGKSSSSGSPGSSAPSSVAALSGGRVMTPSSGGGESGRAAATTGGSSAGGSAASAWQAGVASSGSAAGAAHATGPAGMAVAAGQTVMGAARQADQQIDGEASADSGSRTIGEHEVRR